LADLGVERTDFVGIYTQDLERAKRLYGETCNATLLLTSPDAPYSDGSKP
jgi:hypothetical protein